MPQTWKRLGNGNGWQVHSLFEFYLPIIFCLQTTRPFCMECQFVSISIPIPYLDSSHFLAICNRIKKVETWRAKIRRRLLVTSNWWDYLQGDNTSSIKHRELIHSTEFFTNSPEHKNANIANFILAVLFNINKSNEVCNLEIQSSLNQLTSNFTLTNIIYCK